MTPLRERMIQDLRLAGLADRTVQAYVLAVAHLAQFYSRSPDRISEQEVRDYLEHLRVKRKYAAGSFTIVLCGLRFFYQNTAPREWTLWDLVRPNRKPKLPVVLTRDEVRQALGAVRITSYRVCLTTIYSCGLRLSEGLHVQLSDIDGDRRLLRVLGKGSLERAVPIPVTTLELLRSFWRTHRTQPWLFPSRPFLAANPTATEVPAPIGRSALQSAFVRACKRAGITKKAHVHTLRHSYATHLLEDGVSQRALMDLLGHKNAQSTAIYTHLTTELRDRVQGHIDRLMA